MIDWNRVDELRGDMGEAFGDIVVVFLQEMEEALAKLSADGTPEALGEDMHFLKGAALNLGFADFSALCATGEHDAKTGHADRVDIAAVKQSFAKSRTEFEDGLSQRVD